MRKRRNLTDNCLNQGKKEKKEAVLSNLEGTNRMWQPVLHRQKERQGNNRGSESLEDLMRYFVHAHTDSQLLNEATMLLARVMD
ncbi:Hypothetical predicted protein [Xyrichtys novacula]|uniref:Uncharacterized protein n=1 Tax=Xyrichtys novacula TaxID=13765 RepID=A0AAV1HCU0_XYRNO|nr:Hypothetical predicted protein [Xyrichtys novacula]